MGGYGPSFLVWVAVAAVIVVDLPTPSLAFLPSPRPCSRSRSRSRSTLSNKLQQMSSLTTAKAAARAGPADTGTTNNSNSEEAAAKERRAIVVVGLNGALQRTIVFKPPKGLHVGHVNRASSVGAGIGGKGQNVCVALRKLAEGGKGDADADADADAQEGGGAVDVTLAHFAGGKSGERRIANAMQY